MLQLTSTIEKSCALQEALTVYTVEWPTQSDAFEAYLERNDGVLHIAKKGGVETEEALADVQAALQKNLLTQRADKLIANILQHNHSSQLY
jgi:hypothetical protein